jgi:hypothetical protein
MIAKALVDQFIALLFTGRPLELPPRMWLAAEGPAGELGPRQEINDWEWAEGSALNAKRLSFPESRARFVVQRLSVYDALTGGNLVASFDVAEEVVPEKRILDVPARALSVAAKGI